MAPLKILYNPCIIRQYIHSKTIYYSLIKNVAQVQNPRATQCLTLYYNGMKPMERDGWAGIL